jgi:hypothetical protein
VRVRFHDPLEAAWAAGFYDGEGSTGFSHKVKQAGRQRVYGYVTLAVSQSGSPETLERFQKAVRCGKVYGPYDHKKNADTWRPYWRYMASNRDARKALRIMWPWLSSVKRAQAEAAIALANEQAARPRLRRPKRKLVKVNA